MSSVEFKYKYIIEADDRTKQGFQSAKKNYQDYIKDNSGKNNPVNKNSQTSPIQKSSINAFKKEFSQIAEVFKKEQRHKVDREHRGQSDYYKTISDTKISKEYFQNFEKAIERGFTKATRKWSPDGGGNPKSKLLHDRPAKKHSIGSDLLGGLAAGLRGHLILGVAASLAGVTAKMSNAYQGKLMEQMPLAGVNRVGYESFGSRGVNVLGYRDWLEKKGDKKAIYFNEKMDYMQNASKKYKKYSYDQLVKGKDLILQKVTEGVQENEKRSWYDPRKADARKVYNSINSELKEIEREIKYKKALSEVGDTKGARTAYEKSLSGYQKYAQEATKKQKSSNKIIDSNLGEASSYGLSAADLQRVKYGLLKSGGERKDQLWLGKNWRTAGGYGVATGIGAEQAAGLIGTLNRYSPHGTNFNKLTQIGSAAGYRGAMNPEFIEQVAQGVKQGVEQGFAGTPEEIAMNMAKFTNLKGKDKNLFSKYGLTQDAGINMYKSFQGSMRSTSMLQGGAANEIMLRAVSEHLSKKNPKLSGDKLLMESERFLSNEGNMGQTMKLTKGMLGKMYGDKSYHAYAAWKQIFGNVNQARVMQDADLSQDVNYKKEGVVQGVLPEQMRKAVEIQNKSTKMLMSLDGAGEMAFNATKSFQDQLIKFGDSINGMVQSLQSVIGSTGNATEILSRMEKERSLR